MRLLIEDLCCRWCLVVLIDQKHKEIACAVSGC